MPPDASSRKSGTARGGEEDPFDIATHIIKRHGDTKGRFACADALRAPSTPSARPLQCNRVYCRSLSPCRWGPAPAQTVCVPIARLEESPRRARPEALHLSPARRSMDVYFVRGWLKLAAPRSRGVRGIMRPLAGGEGFAPRRFWRARRRTNSGWGKRRLRSTTWFRARGEISGAAPRVSLLSVLRAARCESTRFPHFCGVRARCPATRSAPAHLARLGEARRGRAVPVQVLLPMRILES